MPSSILNSDDGVISGTSGLKSSGGDDGVLNIQNNGTTAVTVNASGNVGVGTTSPTISFTSAKVLHVNGTASEIRFTTPDTGITNADGFTVGLTNSEEAYVLNRENSNLYFGTNNIVRATVTSGGDFQFNSGYGSVATAYGCRAWVNFNGIGTPAIREDGNVSSITDNGTGDFTLNFTTAMSDANYSVVCTTSLESGQAAARFMSINLNTAMSTTAVRTLVCNDAGTPDDKSVNCVSIFR